MTSPETPAQTPPRATTAERILDAADELFCRDGYDAVSIRDIARHAEVNKASIFYHFNNKDELFARVLERYYDHQRAVLQVAYNREGTPEERLHNTLDTYLDFMEAHYRYPLLIQRIALSQAPHIPLIRDSNRANYAWWRQAIRTLVPEDGPLAARHFYITFIGAVLTPFVYGQAFDALWPEGAFSREKMLRERRAHVRWLARACLMALFKAKTTPSQPQPEVEEPARVVSATAERILEAADELFCRDGYDAVSIRDIARHAEVNKASIFYHFNNKDELFKRVLKRYRLIQRDVLRQAFDDTNPVRMCMHQAVDSYMDFTRQHSRYPMLIQHLALSGDHHLPYLRRNVQPVYLWIRDVTRPLVPKDGPLAARHFYVTFLGAVFTPFIYGDAFHDLWGNEVDRKDPEVRARIMDERREHVHWLVDVFLDALRLPGHAPRAPASPHATVSDKREP